MLAIVDRCSMLSQMNSGLEIEVANYTSVRVQQQRISEMNMNKHLKIQAKDLGW